MTGLRLVGGEPERSPIGNGLVGTCEGTDQQDPPVHHPLKQPLACEQRQDTLGNQLDRAENESLLHAHPLHPAGCSG
jgi:hypothetical protein